MLDAVYAMDVDPNDNERLEGVERAVETLVEIAEAGGYLGQSSNSICISRLLMCLQWILSQLVSLWNLPIARNHR